MTTSLKVRLADNPRAAYLVLVDRFTEERQRFEWPPAPDGQLIPWKSGLSDAGPGDFSRRQRARRRPAREGRRRRRRREGQRLITGSPTDS